MVIREVGVCHLRDGAQTLCGGAGESISLLHFHEHVTPNREGCCENLWSRMCFACISAYGHRL